MRKQECMILFSTPGGMAPGRRRLRILLEAHHHLDFRAEGFAVKFNGFFATAVKEEIGLDE